ncbi:hypothetical protein AAG570_007162 [Ranatra chinensis]|uniref:PH domain-containing protein n=1 Tax=Ranatra chinensis TaxID=642074 RepID=A0ABD0XV34_9HEMI
MLRTLYCCISAHPAGNAGIGPNSAGGGGTGLSKRTSNRSCEWEIIEGLKDGQRYDRKPEPFSGYLHKKRKWPLKGWHKRFFVVDKGILVYGKSPSEVNRGKLHGSLDIGLSVISAKLKEKRLHIDAEEFIYHLKAKQQDAFVEWVEQLKRHRLYRQHVLSYGGEMATEGGGRPVVGSGLGGSGSGSGGQHRVQWLVDSAPLQAVTTELNHTQQALNQLSRILDRLESSAADSEV